MSIFVLTPLNGNFRARSRPNNSSSRAATTIPEMLNALGIGVYSSRCND